MAVVASTARRSLTIIMSFRLYRSTMAAAMGETRMHGTVKQAVIGPRAVALPVSWQAQIVRAKLLMFEAGTDTSRPTQTKVNHAILPRGSRGASFSALIRPLSLFREESPLLRRHPVRPIFTPKYPPTPPTPRIPMFMQGLSPVG